MLCVSIMDSLSTFTASVSNENLYQCFDGNFIPISQLCDRMVDCYGNYREDELPSVCMLKQTCLDHRLAGQLHSSEKVLYISGAEDDYDDGTIDVFCDFESYENQVVTRVTNDTYVQFRSLVDALKMKPSITRCEQAIYFGCQEEHVNGTFMSMDGVEVNFSYERLLSETCGCQFRTGPCGEDDPDRWAVSAFVVNCNIIRQPSYSN